MQKLESNTAKTTVAKYSKFNMEEEQHQQQQQLKSQLASGKWETEKNIFEHLNIFVVDQKMHSRKLF